MELQLLERLKLVDNVYLVIYANLLKFYTQEIEIKIKRKEEQKSNLSLNKEIQR